MITVYGSIALDTIRTPFKTVENVIGGSASHFAYSSSFFDDTAIIGAVGNDFPQGHWDALKNKGIGLEGLARIKDG